LTGLNGFKLGHCSPGPPVDAFPLPYFLPTQRNNMRHPTLTRPGQCHRPTLSSRASRARPPPFPPPPGVGSDPPPLPIFSPLYFDAAAAEHSPTLPSLVHVSSTTEETSNRPPMSAFHLLSALGHRHAATSPDFDQNTAAFLSPVSATSTRTPCDSNHPSPSSSSRGAAGPSRSPMEPSECHN
jgi:hypothetical protein